MKKYILPSCTMLMHTLSLVSMDSPQQWPSIPADDSLTQHNAPFFTEKLYEKLSFVLYDQVKDLYRSGELSSLIGQNSESACIVYRWALRKGNLDMLDLAIRAGISINTRISFLCSQSTALELWIANIDFWTHEWITVLLELNADPNTSDEDGVTPLMYAARYHRFDTIPVLLKYGANPLICDFYGASALNHTPDETTKKIIKDGIDAWKCLVCAATDNTLSLIACSTKHLGTFICSHCSDTIKTQTKKCPVCRNQLI